MCEPKSEQQSGCASWGGPTIMKPPTPGKVLSHLEEGQWGMGMKARGGWREDPGGARPCRTELGF